MPVAPMADQLRAGSELHKRVVDAINARFRLSSNRMSALHKKWKNSEDQFIAYLPERDVDATRRDLREQGGKPQYTTIVLPYTYAMLMSAHSYWTTVFLSRQPIFQYTGRHGETEQQTQALEALIDYQVQAGRMLVPLYFWLLDAGKFGLGVVNTYWCQEQKLATQIIQVPEVDKAFGFSTGKMISQKQVVQIPGYQGNKLVNIRPYDYYPDPRVPLWNVQKGEFVGYVQDVILNDLVRGQAAGQYFNVDVLRKGKQQYGTAQQQGSSSDTLQLPNTDSYTFTAQEMASTGPFGLLTMFIDLIAKDWGLGTTEYPEKWVFVARVEQASPTGGAQQSVDTILQAQPLGDFHQQFPIHVLETEPEAYAFAARGMPEILRPIQNTMDWLINSHMYNVRKVLNDQFVVDPSRVVMKDYLEGTAGGAIRLKPAAYGTDVRTAINQLPIQDVTRSHLADIQFVDQFAQRAAGVTDQIMGMLNSGGRKTAQEIRTSSTFGVNRQKTACELMSAMGFMPLGEQLVLSSQQWYDSNLKLRLVGDLVQAAGPAFLQVDPQAIAGAYDFVPVDGTMPIDRYQQANLWRELMLGMRQIPEVMMQYDFGKIFAWVAQLAGLKNITQFKVQVMPDAGAMAAAKTGNLVALQGGKGTQPQNTIEPGQISGMGQSG